MKPATAVDIINAATLLRLFFEGILSIVKPQPKQFDYSERYNHHSSCFGDQAGSDFSGPEQIWCTKGANKIVLLSLLPKCTLTAVAAGIVINKHT